MTKVHSSYNAIFMKMKVIIIIIERSYCQLNTSHVLYFSPTFIAGFSKVRC